MLYFYNNHVAELQIMTQETSTDACYVDERVEEHTVKNVVDFGLQSICELIKS